MSKYLLCSPIKYLGTPLYNGSIKQIIYSACKETEVYLKSGLVSYISIWTLSVLKGTS